MDAVTAGVMRAGPYVRLIPATSAGAVDGAMDRIADQGQRLTGATSRYTSSRTTAGSLDRLLDRGIQAPVPRRAAIPSRRGRVSLASQIAHAG